jgi:hypothetical protein
VPTLGIGAGPSCRDLLPGDHLPRPDKVPQNTATDWYTVLPGHQGGRAKSRQGYRDATDGVLVSPMTGPCCEAATTRRTVVVPDVAADPKWARFLAFAAPLGAADKQPDTHTAYLRWRGSWWAAVKGVTRSA